MSTAAGVGMGHQKALDAAGISRPDFVFMFASAGDEPRASTGVARPRTVSGGGPCTTR